MVNIVERVVKHEQHVTGYVTTKNISVVTACYNCNRYNVGGIAAWLFITMTQPEEREGTRQWFWFLACRMFAEEGRFNQLHRDLGVPMVSQMTPFRPKRLIHRGRWAEEELVKHFCEYGVRGHDIGSYLRAFSDLWLQDLSNPPEEPDWSKVPEPCDAQARVSTQLARNRRRQCRLAGVGSEGYWVDKDPIQLGQAPSAGEVPYPEEYLNPLRI
jgi:hypothetical protein